MKTKLADKQEQFLQRYVQDFNATSAYEDIYGPKKTRDVTRSAAANLLAKMNVKTRLAEIMRERQERTKVDSTYVIDYLKGVAELDLEEFATIGKSGVTLKEFKKIPKSLRRFCTEVHMTEAKSGRIVVNFKIFSKEKALEMLGKHTGAVKEHVQHSGSIEIKSITDLVKNNS